MVGLRVVGFRAAHGVGAAVDAICNDSAELEAWESCLRRKRVACGPDARVKLEQAPASIHMHSGTSTITIGSGLVEHVLPVAGRRVVGQRDHDLVGVCAVCAVGLQRENALSRATRPDSEVASPCILEDRCDLLVVAWL